MAAKVPAKMDATARWKTLCFFWRRSAAGGTLRYPEHRSPCKRGGVMRVLLAAIFVVAASLPAAGQGNLIGVDDDPSVGDANAKVPNNKFRELHAASCGMVEIY